MLGRRPVILHLFDLPEMVPAMKGVAMELEDCAYPLLHGTCGIPPSWLHLKLQIQAGGNSQ